MSAIPQRPFHSHRALPERTAPTFASSQVPSRDTARFDRERPERDRAQQHAQAQTHAPPSNALSNLTDEQREEINEAFGLFDLDKDQRIDYHEFKVALKALGFDLPKSEIVHLLTIHGNPPSNSSAPGPSSRPEQAPTATFRLLLTLSSFQTIAADLISKRHPRDEIMRAFALFDVDQKGMISLDDLRRVARELGEGLEEEELQAMIEEFDLEGKGGVGSEEFIGICMG